MNNPFGYFGSSKSRIAGSAAVWLWNYNQPRSRFMVSPDTTGLNLLISDKPDIERDALGDAFARGGGEIHRLGRFWDPPIFDPATVRVYGADSFCLVLQQKLGFHLCSPADDLLLQVPSRFLQRRIAQRTLAEALTALPGFVKPVTPKQFRGAVYTSAEELAAECQGLPPQTAVIVAEPVVLIAEVRSFVLDGRVLDAALYEGDAALRDATAFIGELTQAMPPPRTVVIDVGFIAGRGWAVIEFNAAWGAGLQRSESPPRGSRRFREAIVVLLATILVPAPHEPAS